MSYEKYYPNGWQSGQSGGTPLTPEALNYMEQGIANLDSGKAPAGYGLGGTAQGTYITSASDLDSIKKNGWYALWADYNIDIAGFTNSFFTLEVAMFNDNYGRQTVHMASDGSVTRICNNGTWGEWEWVNPPMALGVEYRTTERWDGRAVYTMLIYCGYMPTAGGTTRTELPSNINGWVDMVLRVNGTDSSGNSIPYSWEGEYITEVSASRSAVYIYAKDDFSSNQAYVQIWYVRH